MGYVYIGYNTEEDDEVGDSGRDSERSLGGSPRRSPKRKQVPALTYAKPLIPTYISASSDKAMLFNIAHGFLYKYPNKSHTGDNIGSFSILGALVHVSINRWNKRESAAIMDDNVTNSQTGMSTRITETFGMGEVEKSLEANSEGQGYIHYEVSIRHHNDEWSVWRRYREFETYSKVLYKHGIKPSQGVSAVNMYRLSILLLFVFIVL